MKLVLFLNAKMICALFVFIKQEMVRSHSSDMCIDHKLEAFLWPNLECVLNNERSKV